MKLIHQLKNFLNKTKTICNFFGNCWGNFFSVRSKSFPGFGTPPEFGFWLQLPMLKIANSFEAFNGALKTDCLRPGRPTSSRVLLRLDGGLWGHKFNFRAMNSNSINSTKLTCAPSSGMWTHCVAMGPLPHNPTPLRELLFTPAGLGTMFTWKTGSLFGSEVSEKRVSEPYF